EPHNFSGDVIALVVENVMRARAPGQLHRLRRAATADDEARFEYSCGHLNCQMTYATAATRDVDDITSIDSVVQAREGGQEGHGRPARIGKARASGLGDGQDLLGRGVAALVPSGPAGNPAAITIRVGHRRHRIADRDATHGAPLGYNDARQIEAEDDGRRSPKEVELSKLVLQGVQGRGGNADQYLVGCGPPNWNTHRFQGEPSPIS